MYENAFLELVQWVITHGYLLFLLAAFLEGPLVTAAAGVAASLGYYDVSIIIILAVLGDLLPDIVYYSVGYWGGRPLINKYGRFWKLTPERIQKFEKLIHRNMAKALVIVKLSPLIPVPGLIMIGASHASPRRFAIVALIITLPKALLFVLIGFYSGKAYERLASVIQNTQYAIFGLGILILVFYLIYRKTLIVLSKKMEGQNIK